MQQRETILYTFSAKPWQYAGPGGWIFVSLPVALSSTIRKRMKEEEQGWGRLSTTARVGKTEWKTAIWFDTKKKTYLLPLKAAIRKKEQVKPLKKLDLTIWV